MPTVWLANVSAVGEIDNTGAAPARPFPDKLTVCGLSPALSAIWIEPLRAPTAVGVNVTLIVHVDPAAMFVLQVFV